MFSVFFYERNVYFLENARPVRWWRAILHGVMDVVSLATRFIKVSVKRGSEPYLLNQSFDYVQNMLEAKTNRNLQVSCLAAKGVDSLSPQYRLVCMPLTLMVWTLLFNLQRLSSLKAWIDWATDGVFVRDVDGGNVSWLTPLIKL